MNSTLDQEQHRLKAEMDARKARHPYPGGWRANSLDTEAERAGITSRLERWRLKQERGKPLTIALNGHEFGRQHYLHMRAGALSGTAWNNISNRTMGQFLRMNPEIKRRRIRWGLYFNVSQFEKAWQKRLTRPNRTKKSRKVIDGESDLTQDSPIRKVI